MSDMYTILINEDHSFTHTNKKRIMYRSNDIDSIRFLVKPNYGDLDMTTCNTVLEYVTPISRKYDVIVLKPSEELYKNRVEFILPIDTRFTSEVGELELTINFSYLSKNDDGTFKEQVRPIGYTSLLIEDTVRWSDYIASSSLDNIAQIMLTNQSMMEEIKAQAELIAYDTPNTLVVQDGKLHIGKDGEPLAESVGVDVVFPRTSDDDGRSDGVVELGEVVHDDSDPNCDCGCNHDNFEELDGYITAIPETRDGNFSEL